LPVLYCLKRDYDFIRLFILKSPAWDEQDDFMETTGVKADKSNGALIIS
jgi:hypothetical protein